PERSRSRRRGRALGGRGVGSGRLDAGGGAKGSRRCAATGRRARIGVVPAATAPGVGSEGARRSRRRNMRLTVNGEQRDLHSPPLTSLLTALREELEITSPKAGCHQGGCGACTVLVDGEARRSCLLPLA